MMQIFEQMMASYVELEGRQIGCCWTLVEEVGCSEQLGATGISVSDCSGDGREWTGDDSMESHV